MGYSDDALLYYGLAKDLSNTNMQASILGNIAGIYNDKGELDKALSYLEKSLSLETNEEEKATTYNNIAMIYYQKGDYQNAVEYFQKAIEIYEKYGDYHGVSMVKLNLGDIYREMKDYKNAEKYLSEGLEGVKKVGDKYWEATGYGYLGVFYANKGNIESKRTHCSCIQSL
jgi:tetratricopeptide (TPR) repeat protein